MDKFLCSAAAIVISMSTIATDAQAGDRHRRHDRPIYSTNGNLPSFLPGIGTYVGGVSAIRDRGNGIYFYVERGVNVQGLIVRDTKRRKPSVITIDPDSHGKACSWEAGVCVIRN